MTAIIDYGAGNLTSVALAVKHLGGEATVTSDPALVDAAERVIFPGQGAAGQAMANLRATGLGEAVRRAVDSGRPVLGICIAHQLVYEHSDEDGGTPCLGLLPGRVVRFVFPPERHVKIPHMGWNGLKLLARHPVLADFGDGWECYFVHSYLPLPATPELVLAETEYQGATFASICGRGNLVTTQFHPEKSGRAGLRLLENFLTWDGRPC